MDKLTDKNKELFENQIKRITPKDEKKVLNGIEDELNKLRVIANRNQSFKIKNLISNAELLLEILVDKDFPLGESTRKWIIFGLGYLISDLDLIPDAIPYIGYNDDALILQWVIHMIDKDISRYNQYKQALKDGEKGNIIHEFIPGNQDNILILLPGLLPTLVEDSRAQWKEKIQLLREKFNHASVYIFEHQINHLNALVDVIRIIDHEMKLKPSYEQEDFKVQWQQLRKEHLALGEGLAKDIKELKNRNPNLSIDILAIGTTTLLAEKAIEVLPKDSVSKYYSFGNMQTNMEIINKVSKKTQHIDFYFFEADYLIQFIFENFEANTIPMGIQPTTISERKSIKYHNLKDKISKHSDYLLKIDKIL